MFHFTCVHVEIKSASGDALVTNWRSVPDACCPKTVQIKHDNDWHCFSWLRKVIKNSRSLSLSNVLIQWWNFSYMMQKIPPDRKLTFGLPFNSSMYNSAAGKRAMWAAWAPLLRSQVFLYFLHTNLNKQCLIRACFRKGYSWDALAVIFYPIQFESHSFPSCTIFDVSLYCSQNQSDSEAACSSTRQYSLMKVRRYSPEEPLEVDSLLLALPCFK